MRGGCFKAVHELHVARVAAFEVEYDAQARGDTHAPNAKAALERMQVASRGHPCHWGCRLRPRRSRPSRGTVPPALRRRGRSQLRKGASDAGPGIALSCTLPTYKLRWICQRSARDQGARVWRYLASRIEGRLERSTELAWEIEGQSPTLQEIENRTWGIRLHEEEGGT